MSRLIRIEKDISINEAIEKIKENAPKFDFIIRDIFDMAEQFKHHGVKNVEDDFEYYSIMLCNPQKAYDSIYAKPIRGAALLPPKQVVVYKEEGKTIIAYAATEEIDVKALMPDDEMFQKGLSLSCSKIVDLIKSIE